MSLEIINRELQGRTFDVAIDGKTFKLKSLNSFKKQVQELLASVDPSAGMVKIIYATGDQAFIDTILKCSEAEVSALFESWFEWTGVEAKKAKAALAAINEFTDAVEMDLLRLGLTYKDYFNLSLRQQVSIIDRLLEDPKTTLCLKASGWRHSWGPLEEIAALNLEAFYKSHGAKVHYPRPWEDEASKKKGALGFVAEAENSGLSPEERRAILKKQIAEEEAK